MRADSAESYEPALAGAIAEGANALFVRSGLGTNANARLIGGLSEQLRIPATFPSRSYVAGGGLKSYEPNAADTGRRAADFLDRILRGARPSDLPIERPTRYALIVNLGTARALGLTLSRDFMSQVDEVIE